MAASVRDDDPLVPPERVEGIGVLTSHLRHTGLGSERDILNGVHRLLGGKDWRNETGWVEPDERGAFRFAFAEDGEVGKGWAVGPLSAKEDCPDALVVRFGDSNATTPSPRSSCLTPSSREMKEKGPYGGHSSQPAL